ncbi:MAG: hypothetical protein N2035_01165 [Chthoniobacterales bacterium]|nr:hypothetical protein [Chthoniobacterales bacterium]
MRFVAYASNEITTGHEGGEPIHRLIIRRSQFINNWQIGYHGQGIWFAGHASKTFPSFLIEECLFNHNGWRIHNQNQNPRDNSRGQAQMLNHNLYRC